MVEKRCENLSFRARIGPMVSRPPTALAAMGLAVAAGVLLFLPLMDLTLKTQALAALPVSAIPGARAGASPLPEGLTTLAVWAPLIIGAVILYAYVRAGLRLLKPHPGAIRTGVTVAGVFIALPVLVMVGSSGRAIPITSPLILGLNIGLIACLLLPPTRAYVKGAAPAPAAPAPQAAPPPAYTPPPAPPPAAGPERRFCAQCGTPLPGGSSFCPSCGTRK